MTKNFPTRFGALALVILFSVASCAQTKKSSAGSGGSYAKLIEATSQRTIPGIRDAQIETTFKFVIVWQSKEQPEEFFWKAPEMWQHCMVSRVRSTGKRTGSNDWYKTEQIELSTLKEGDTLELIPVRGGKFPIPATIPTEANNVIIFKTNKSNWLTLAVDKITKKPDIVMH